MKRIILAATVSLSLASAAGASTLDGLTVQVDFRAPNLSTTLTSSGPVVVRPGVEAVYGGINIDVSGTSISFSDPIASGFFFGDAEFNGFVLSDVGGTFAPFSSASIASSLLTRGTPIITFDDDNLFINLSDVIFQSSNSPALGTFLTVDFTIGEAAVVPLPAGLPLLLAGLGGLALLRRRRRPA